MVSFFAVYDLLSRSGLFDPSYYLSSDPDALSGIDPLSHYIEFGAAEGRNPSPTFDTAYYLEQCAQVGAQPEIPLLHFVEEGAALGLTTQRPTILQQSTGNAQIRLECDAFDLTENGKITVHGWTVGESEIKTVTVFLDELPIGDARLGIERADVANLYPNDTRVRFSGFHFEAVIDGGIKGEHVIRLRARSHNGASKDMQRPVVARPMETVPEPSPDEVDIQFAIDSPNVVNGAATAPVTSSLSINGWALATNGVASVDVAIDAKRLMSAYYGIRRDDVALAFPERTGSLLSGFAALIPARALARGLHKVSITVRDKTDNITTPLEFTIDVGEIAEEEGPWTLRRKIAQSEVELYERRLTAADWHPRFELIMPVGSQENDIRAARTTLNSLALQPYAHWQVVAVAATTETDMKRVKRELLRGLDEIAGKISFKHAAARKERLDQIAASIPNRTEPCFAGILVPGDELSIDALLEFASWSAMHPDAELIYSDERRLNPGTGQQDAFFKPDWSPDLLLSTNYIGHLWIGSLSLLRLSGVTLDDLAVYGEYDVVIRLTEHAAKIGHVPHILLQRAKAAESTQALNKAALERTLSRRGIPGTVADGCAPEIFQIRRTHSQTGLVSIVIPTMAVGGLIKICLETIRNITDYRNFEIVCIENIPKQDRVWRDWLKGNADKVISTTEPFNWSRFNNLAAEQASGEYLIFLNDDIEIISANWIDVLLSFAQRREVGIVGPLLLYPDRSIQHAGVFLTRNGIARHAFRYGGEDDCGYFGLALTDRNVIGVTGACLMTRRETFDLVGGFDESHTVINNDLDYCLRVWDAGFLNVYTAQTRLIHHELASRSEISDDYDRINFDKRWSETFLRGDPYFHPRLSKEYDDYVIDREPMRVVCPGHPVLSSAQIRRLLITKLDHIGDAVTAIPAINRLRTLFPDARISVMGARSTKSIWSMIAGIDEVIEFDFFHERSGLGPATLTDRDLVTLRERLIPYRFDLAVDLRKSPDTRHILRYTNARYLAGFGHQADFPWLDIALEWEGDPRFLRKHSHISDDLMRLVQAIELACSDNRVVVATPKSLDHWPAFLPKDFSARRIVAVHPAAGTPTRQWPPRYFAQLINLLIKDHDVNIAIIGGADETDIADAIMADILHPERVVSCLGKMKLQETIEFLPKCALFVGNNSGPSHIAAAVGVPTVAVHSGVIASEEWGPYGLTGVAVRRDMTCAPCYIAELKDCPRSLACLGRLGAGEILEVCSQFLIANSLPRASAQRPKGQRRPVLR